ncbi:MAG TPA: sigma factor, partial [Acidimicrobiales bacterium]|nr:sigma factor [Acidimicrobiales bacterium]
MRRDGPPDKRLFRRARHGDRQAFVVLLRRYDPRLRRLVLRLVADPTRVDVVLNRAYLRAWRSLPHVEPPESVAEWLYRIVYNACVNEVRWAPARPMAGPPEGPWVPLPLASASRRLAGLRALSPEDRVPLVLVDGEGFSLEAAANILRRPEVDVAADVTRARQLWRRLVVGEPEPRGIRSTVVLAPPTAEVEAEQAEVVAAAQVAAETSGDPRGHVKVVDPRAAAAAGRPRPRPAPAKRHLPPPKAAPAKPASPPSASPASGSAPTASASPAAASPASGPALGAAAKPAAPEPSAPEPPTPADAPVPAATADAPPKAAP